MRASDARHHPRKGIHQHDHYEILFIKQGTGSHWVDFDIHAVMPCQVYFLRPGQMHEFSPDPGALFYFIAFDKHDVMLNERTELRTFDFFQSFHCQGPVVLDEVDSLIKQMVDIQYELDHPGAMQYTLLSGLLTVLLIKLQRKFRQFKTSQIQITHDLVMEFNMLIDYQKYPFRLVKMYAKALHVSTTYLNDVVKKSTGYPASYWIHKKQVTVAKQCLTHHNMTLKIISAKLGFSNPTHFSRFFKAHTGQTPTQYRRTLQ
jgi:AraC family transcriptional activator of pobA